MIELLEASCVGGSMLSTEYGVEEWRSLSGRLWWTGPLVVMSRTQDSGTFHKLKRRNLTLLLGHSNQRAVSFCLVGRSESQQPED